MENQENEEFKVTIKKNGPLRVSGTFKIVHLDGSEETIEGTKAFCRCASSKKMPYCDGEHKNLSFTFDAD